MQVLKKIGLEINLAKTATNTDHLQPLGEVLTTTRCCKYLGILERPNGEVDLVFDLNLPIFDQAENRMLAESNSARNQATSEYLVASKSAYYWHLPMMLRYWVNPPNKSQVKHQDFCNLQ